MQVRYQAALRPDEVIIIAAALADLGSKAVPKGNFSRLPSQSRQRSTAELSGALLKRIKPGK
jgi:hypothetical protein